MAFAYQPFLIANLAYGLELGLQPWLLPQDAFVELQNAYLSRGVLYKRKGYEAFSRLVHRAIEEVIGVGNGADYTFAGTLSNFVGMVGYLSITSGTETFNDLALNGILVGDKGGTGTINYNTGEYSVTFNNKGWFEGRWLVNGWFAVPPGVGVLIQGTYNYYSNLPCMGMWNYTNSSGGQDLLAFTTRRLNRYNGPLQRFEDISGVDVFTGDDNEFFWMANWLNRAFIANGKDQLQIYDGSEAVPLDIDLTVLPAAWQDSTVYSVDNVVHPTVKNGYYYKCTTPGTSHTAEPAAWGTTVGGTTAEGGGTVVWTCFRVNNVNSAQLVFPFKDRLVLLRTVEEGTTYAQRARWSPVGKYTDWEPLDYVDAPTHEWIMGAAWIKNDLIVWFERSIWALRYTGDVRLPFRWVRIASNEGLTSKMALADFSDEILGLGPTRLVGTDGQDSYNVDDRIPNLVLSMNQAKLDYCMAAILDDINQLWLSFPSQSSDLPDKVLVLNYDEKSFSLFTLAMFAFGYFDRQTDLTWDDIDLTWNEMENAWDERSLTPGYPILLGADYQGYVWKMNIGGADNGAAIEFAAKSSRLNPFIKEGKKARLGWVDFLVDRDPIIELTVEYRINHESAVWMADTFVLDDGSEDEKIWLRSYVGCEAEFHQLRIYNNRTAQTPVIHAIMPWFCPGGSIN